MRLFLMRALEALRPTGHERLAFCFGTGERHLVKALEVQSLLGDLRLALEAMLPGFNRYDGAEAIGARSDLYICRPTKGAKVGEDALARGWSASAPERRPPDLHPRPVGARRPASTPCPRRSPPPPSPRPAKARSSSSATAGLRMTSPRPARVRCRLGGEGGEGGEGGAKAAVPLPNFFARVAAWATAARPGPFPFTGTPVINTHPRLRRCRPPDPSSRRPRSGPC